MSKDDDICVRVENKVVGEGGPFDPIARSRQIRLPENLSSLMFTHVYDSDGLVRGEKSPSILRKYQEVAEHYSISVPEAIRISLENDNWDLHQNDEVVEYLARQTQLTVEEVADTLDASAQIVRDRLADLGIENKSGNVWNDEITWVKRADEVRELDQNECVKCGKTSTYQKREFGCDLHVHHVVPRKFVGEKNQMHAVENLVTLCSECHREFEQDTPRSLFLSFIS